MVSITITVVLMIVISITVLSFAQIIRREQRQALDNQLSSQAYYAAESGINDTRQYVADHYAGQVPPNKYRCDNSEGTYNLPMTIDAATTTGYSCVLVEGSPKLLKYALSTTATSKVIPIDAGAGKTISSLEISWTPADTNSPLQNCATSAADLQELPNGLAPDNNPANGVEWQCGYGMIRLDLTPFPHTGTTRAATTANTFTAFIMPLNTATSQSVSFTGNGGNINGGSANQGGRPAANCDLDSCKITITGLNTDRYYARASALYRDSTLSVVAKNSTGQPLGMSNAQLVIDATGRSQDVLRRIQVRLPLTGDGVFSDYGIQTTDSLCKQFTTYPGFGYNAAICN